MSHQNERLNQERGDLGSWKQKEAEGILKMLVWSRGICSVANLTLTGTHKRPEVSKGKSGVCIYLRVGGWGMMYIGADRLLE